MELGSRPINAHFGPASGGKDHGALVAVVHARGRQLSGAMVRRSTDVRSFSAINDAMSALPLADMCP
jgi:hypothetical protein